MSVPALAPATHQVQGVERSFLLPPASPSDCYASSTASCPFGRDACVYGDASPTTVIKVRRILDKLGFALCALALAACVVLHLGTFLGIISPMWLIPPFFCRGWCGAMFEGGGTPTATCHCELTRCRLWASEYSSMRFFYSSTSTR